MAAKAPREMTEVEYCVLGAIWLRGPCSAYTIRQEFAQSSTSFWSSSAGSIYPVIERLIEARLIVSTADKADGRGKRELAATPAGMSALRSWIGDVPDWAGKATLDPIRTRLNFIAALTTVAAQRSFVQRAEDRTREALGGLEAFLAAEDYRDEAERLAALGSICELEGRLKWLAVVRKALQRGRIR
jgi:DNA-binding PadR family transcriptional regulator